MMQARVITFQETPLPPLHRARDGVDLRDPLLQAMLRAHRASGKSLATREQTLSELVPKLRLVDAAQR